MTTHGAVEAIEIERKYEVSATAELPELGVLSLPEFSASAGARPEPNVALGGSTELLSASIENDEYELRATYFDTDSGELGQHRVAVRRREGGSDAGWHLKTKQGDVSRELMWPLSDSMPHGLVETITELIGGEGLERMRPIATLHTVRRVIRWAPHSGPWALEIADDTVRGTNELTNATQTWREWEVELAPGADAAWLNRIEPLMISAGATRSHGTSKLQRVMGRPAQQAVREATVTDHSEMPSPATLTSSSEQA